MTLRDWMEKQGISPQTLAALIGADTATLRSWVSGRLKPSMPERQLIAQVSKGAVGAKDWT